jgi:hypothetical protein
MEAEYDTLVCELQRRGVAVVPDPDANLPDDGFKAGEVVRRALAAAEWSIHLVGERVGLTPNGLDVGIVALQLAEAREMAEQRSQFARLLWIPKLFRAAEAENAGLRDPFEVLGRFDPARPLASDEIESDTASRFNEFVLQRLMPRITSSQSTKTYGYVGALPVDQRFRDVVARRIKALGASPIFGPTTLLARADHVIFCWGQADEIGLLDELDTPALRTWRASHPAAHICLVIFPPVTDTKLSALEVGSYGEADCVIDANSDDLDAQLRSIVKAGG